MMNEYDRRVKSVMKDKDVDYATAASCVRRYMQQNKKLEMALNDADIMKANWDAACNELAELQATNAALLEKAEAAINNPTVRDFRATFDDTAIVFRELEDAIRKAKSHADTLKGE